MNTSQLTQLTELLRQRREVRDFEGDFAIATKLNVGMEGSSNVFLGVSITTAYRNAVTNMVADRKAQIDAGIAALGVTQDD